MKKTSYVGLIIFFIFSLMVTMVRAEDTNLAVPLTTAITATSLPVTANKISDQKDLEKIASPEDIKYFKMIKKIGNSLFGVRKATKTDNVELKKMEIKSNLLKSDKSAKPQQLEMSDKSEKSEKIDHPSLVNLYQNIKKIGNALWGVKRLIVPKPVIIIEPEISACVVSAIKVKDEALMARVSAMSTELNEAIATRSTCQQAAVSATSSPQEGLKNCVQAFNETHKIIKETSKKQHKDIWTIYQQSFQACRANTADTSPVPMIEDGDNIFD